MKKSQLRNNICIAIATLSTFLIIGGPILLCLGSAVIFSGCNSDPTLAHEMPLTRSMDNKNEPECLRQGEVIEMGYVPGSDSLMVLRMHDPNQPADYTFGAVVAKDENVRVGDEVKLCYIDQFSNSKTSRYTVLIFARKVGGSDEPSELEKCKEELSECNEHVSTLIKAIESKDSPSN